MVGADGVEPSTSWSRTKRASQLRYAPINLNRMNAIANPAFPFLFNMVGGTPLSLHFLSPEADFRIGN